MIIDKKGNILPSVWAKYGIIVIDGPWSIFLPYEKEEDIPRAERIIECKTELKDTDYITLKYMEGVISDEVYEETKVKRQALRDEINALEKLITYPTITREEMDAAEEAASKKGE